MVEFGTGRAAGLLGPLSLDTEERSLQNANRVFRNSLILERICFFADSITRHKLRLVNHLFHNEVSKIIQKDPSYIIVNTEARLKQLLDSRKNRGVPGLTPLPFVAFQVTLDIGLEPLEKFAKTFGQYIDRYSFMLRMLRRRFVV